MGKRLLITGYPGWLTTRLLETWQFYNSPFTEIRCLVLPGLEAPVQVAGQENVSGDVLEPGSLKKACEGVDTVLHTVGLLHVRHIREFYEVNHKGTLNLLEAAHQAGVRKFVYISSNAAQGFCSGKGAELSESQPCNPASHYGKSKYLGEVETRRFHADGKLQTVIIRPAMFYGPPVPPRHLDIYRKVLKGYFPVFGHGEYLRSLTHIDNLVQGVHLALHKEEANGNTYYIADEVIPTLNQIIDTMANALGCRVRRVHLPAFLASWALILDEMITAFGGYWMLPHIVGESTKHIACSIEKAKKELGYAPKMTYREGYPQAIRWCYEKGLLAEGKRA